MITITEVIFQTLPKQDSDEFEESNLPSAPTPSAVHVPNTPAVEERYEPVDETDVDVSDTVSTLASQISAPAGKRSLVVLFELILCF